MAEKSRKLNVMLRYLLLIALLCLTACTSDKDEINALLDQRDISISHKDISAYASLLSDNYLQEHGQLAVQSMQQIFSRFDQVEMNSRDRRVQINDENHAICEQTYILKVLADGEWRNIVQREQLKFHRENDVWKINGGL